MAHACGCHAKSVGVLDVRAMAPKLRHPKIFETFDALGPGESFVLVNDHDPKPLYYQFAFERASAFGWQYLEEGPEVWRVEIGKAGAVLSGTRTVAEVVHLYPDALDVMKEMGINHCCGAQLTLTEAAATAGISLETLLAALRRAVSDEAPHPALSPEGRGVEGASPEGRGIEGRRQVHLDVREDIRAGREPFARIMSAVKALAPDEVLVLRTPFEPIPLFDVLAKRGFAHWTECRGADDWCSWFYRATREEAARTIDVRGLEPPQPMVRILEELERLRPGERLEVLHERRPMFLYPQLDDRGFTHETEELEPGLVRIVIRCAAPAP